MYVTHTVLGDPRVILTSRTAKGLSGRGKQGTASLLCRVDQSKAAVILDARSRSLVGRFPKEICQYRSGYLGRYATVCGGPLSRAVGSRYVR